jgi:hypothetical protein
MQNDISSVAVLRFLNNCSGFAFFRIIIFHFFLMSLHLHFALNRYCLQKKKKKSSKYSVLKLLLSSPGKPYLGGMREGLCF